MSSGRLGKSNATPASWPTSPLLVYGQAGDTVGHNAGEDELTQLVLDFVESGLRAGFGLVTARSAGNRDAADRVIAHLDRQAASPVLS